MAQHNKDLSISNLVIQCGGLASVMENSLGPHGRSVLMEKSGCVTITQDGIELLSSLSVHDPVLDMVSQGIIDQSQIFGDGSKRTLLLLRCLVRSLDKYVFPFSHVPQSLRRQRMLQIIHEMRDGLMPSLQKLIFEVGVQVYPIHNFEALGEIFGKSAECFFITKFSKLIAKHLAKLFTSYLYAQCSSSGDLVKLLENIARNSVTAIVEVYNTPLLKSHVAPGFIITRDFKLLDPDMSLDNVPFIFWSIVLEDTEDCSTKPVIETCDSDVLINSIMIRNKYIAKCLAVLRTLCACIIFSSVHFPDWAILECKKNGFSVIDMINTDEWNYLTAKFSAVPVTSVQDISSKSIRVLEKAEQVTLGTSHFIKLHIPKVNQIVLCCPTASQCKQFSSAFCRFFRYLNNWIMDCLLLFKCTVEVENNEAGGSTDESFPFDSLPLKNLFKSPFIKYNSIIQGNGVTKVNLLMSSDDALPLFYSVPNSGYMELFAKYLIVNDIVDTDKHCDICKSVTTDLLNEIPFLLHKKSCLPHDRYMEYNTRFDSCLKLFLEQKDDYLLTNFLCDMKFRGYENPFLFFKILDAVFIFALSILRIECIIPTNTRLTQIVSSDVENSDVDEYFGLLINPPIFY